MSRHPEADDGQPPAEAPPVAQPLSKAEKRQTLLHWLLATAGIGGLILLGSILAG